MNTQAIVILVAIVAAVASYFLFPKEVKSLLGMGGSGGGSGGGGGSDYKSITVYKGGSSSLPPDKHPPTGWCWMKLGTLNPTTDDQECNNVEESGNREGWFLDWTYDHSAPREGQTLNDCKKRSLVWDKKCGVNGVKYTIGTASEATNPSDIHVGNISDPITFVGAGTNDAGCCSCTRLPVDGKTWTPGSTGCEFNVEVSKLVGDKIWNVDTLCGGGSDPLVASTDYSNTSNATISNCPLRRYCGWGCGSMGSDQHIDLKQIKIPRGIEVILYNEKSIKMQSFWCGERDKSPITIDLGDPSYNYGFSFRVLPGYKVVSPDYNAWT